MSKIDHQALREKAEKATWGDWDSYKPHRGARGYEVRLSSQAIAQHVLKNNAEFIAAFNPNVALALLDERERNLQYIKSRDQENEEIALTVGKLRVELEAANKRIAELEAEPVSQTYKLNELSGNSPVTPDSWISRFEEMPDPSSEKRVCAFTPTNHEDMRYRFVPASLFKTVCRDATHWFYMLPPVGREEVAGG